MATHSSIPAWRIPWTEEPSRPQSVGLLYVSPNSSHFHDPPHHRHPLLPLVSIHLFSMHVSLFFANRFICTIFLDSTCMHQYTIFGFLFLTYFTLYDRLWSIHVSTDGIVLFVLEWIFILKVLILTSLESDAI